MTDSTPQYLPSAGRVLGPDAVLAGPVGEHLVRVHVGDGSSELRPAVLSSEKIQLGVGAGNRKQIGGRTEDSEGENKTFILQ